MAEIVGKDLFRKEWKKWRFQETSDSCLSMRCCGC